MDGPESSDPLVGAREQGLDSLVRQLEGGDLDPRLVAARYSGLRRVRGDGNCFFRCVMFRVAELAFADRAGALPAMQKLMRESLDYLTSAGYDRMAVETFYEMVVEFFDDELPAMSALLDVERAFQDFSRSEHIVWYARALCAAFMKKNLERFEPFLPERYVTVAQYCAAEVEPVGKECEELEITALCDVLRVRVEIEYLSSKTRGQEVRNAFGPDDGPVVHLLYRPGHYDVLYR